MKRLAASAVILLTATVAVPLAAERTWTRSEILAVADQEAKRLGYDVEQMSVSFDVYNSQWRDYLKSLEGAGGMPDIEAKLKDREPLAVYYAPMKRFQLGGDLWIFIDWNTGEVIETIRGE
jgi:hypothetical protein